jgi:hypothetical protein
VTPLSSPISLTKELPALEERCAAAALAGGVLEAGHAPLDDAAVEAHWRLRRWPLALQVRARARGVTRLALAACLEWADIGFCYSMNIAP